MEAKKAILTGTGVFILVFAGVMAALQADRLLAQARPTGVMELPQEASVIPAQLGVTKPAFDFTQAAKKLSPSVVSVDNYQRGRMLFGDEFIQKASGGSGVIISSDGYILTNHHVVQRATFLKVRLADGRSFPASKVGEDRRSDLALLKITATGLTPAAMGDSSKLQIGQWVMALGSPLGYDQTLSVGVVSSLGRTLPTQGAILVDTIQTDAAINQGNSGGALATASGELIGINTAIASMDGGSIGIGFAIPVHRAKRVVDDIIRYGRARYGETGLRFGYRDGLLSNNDARQQLAEIVGSSALPPDRGLIVSGISSGSAAAQAGLKRLDVITQADGKRLEASVDIEVLLLNKRPGDKLNLTVWSAGKSRQVTLTLTDSQI